MLEPWTTCLFAQTCWPLWNSCSGMLQSHVYACMHIHPSLRMLCLCRWMSLKSRTKQAPQPWQLCLSGPLQVPMGPQPFAKHPVHLNLGKYLFPRPQYFKHRPPVKQQLNSIYSLPIDGWHSLSDMWRVSSTELTTPSQWHGAEAKRLVPSA